MNLFRYDWAVVDLEGFGRTADLSGTAPISDAAPNAYPATSMTIIGTTYHQFMLSSTSRISLQFDTNASAT